MPKLINQAKIIILALALALGISYVSAAGTWAPPTAVPPGGMVDVPLNVGSNAQIKAGDLGVGAFLANLNSQFLGNVTIGTTTSPAQLRLVNGTQGAGKVLTSDASGNATWAAVSGSGTADLYEVSCWISNNTPPYFTCYRLDKTTGAVLKKVSINSGQNWNSNETVPISLTAIGAGPYSLVMSGHGGASTALVCVVNTVGLSSCVSGSNSPGGNWSAFTAPSF